MRIEDVLAGIDPTLQPVIITAAATIVAAFLAASVVMIQVGRQARYAVAQNKHNEAMKLKLKVYEEIATAVNELSRAETKYSSYVRQFVSELELCQAAVSAKVPLMLPRVRWLGLSKRHEALLEKAIALMITIERWEIVDPRMDLFRIGVSVALRDMSNASQAHHGLAVRCMPMTREGETDDQATLPWKLPQDDVVQRIKATSDALIDASMELGSYAADFQLEMQNLLVGELFGKVREPRKPLDPKLLVLRLDRYDSLKTHFERNTEWGEDKQQAEKRVLDDVTRAGQSSIQ